MDARAEGWVDAVMSSLSHNLVGREQLLYQGRTAHRLIVWLPGFYNTHTVFILQDWGVRAPLPSEFHSDSVVYDQGQ